MCNFCHLGYTFLMPILFLITSWNKTNFLMFSCACESVISSTPSTPIRSNLPFLALWNKKKEIFMFCYVSSFSIISVTSPPAESLWKSRCWFFLTFLLGMASFYTYHHHHHVVPLAWISLTLSRHFSLSFIASGRSSGPHPVSSHSCWM